MTMKGILTPKKKNLALPVLKAFSGKFLKLSKLIAEGTDVFAFYRGEIYEDSDCTLGMYLVASDENGNFVPLQVIINQVTGSFKYNYGNSIKNWFRFNNEKAILDAIIEVIKVAESLNFSLSTIYFEVATEGYKRGCAEPDPKEEGSYIMYIFSEEEISTKFYLKEAIARNKNSETIKELCGKWGVGVHNKQ